MLGVQTPVMPIPLGLTAVGTSRQPFTPVLPVVDLPLGAMRRFTSGDRDFLLVNTVKGVCVTDDRCPHMAAPLSLGDLDGCVVGCPLHKGRFDLETGDAVQFPTTGGLDADGGYHPPWTPAGAPDKPEPTDLKAQARALTRVRRLRYYPVRIMDGAIEVQLPPS
jgi:3-phenylpropionate/trans-cinnamate dioxygenase ferredoxin component